MNINLEDIKSIELSQLFDIIGIRKVKSSNKYDFFYSPFRVEKEPSVIVNKKINKWKDLGDVDKCKYMDIFDMLKFLFNYDFKKSIEYIKKLISNKTIEKSNPSEIDSCKINILYSREGFRKSIIKYIVDIRKINYYYALKYLSEYTIEFVKKDYKRNKFFYIGWLCGDFKEHTGVELRAPYSSYKIQKASSGNKGITIIKGIYNTNIINIFEGMFDFLSICTMLDTKPYNTTIILNSLSFYFLVEEYFEFSKNTISFNLYLDNDNAGNNVKTKFKENKFKFNDMSYIYKDYKDVNDFWVSFCENEKIFNIFTNNEYLDERNKCIKNIKNGYSIHESSF